MIPNGRMIALAKKKCAFMMMGGSFDAEIHRSEIDTGTILCSMRCVANMEEALACAIELAGQGYGALELCGAFGEERAAQITAAVGQGMAVGYVTASPGEQVKLRDFFLGAHS